MLEDETPDAKNEALVADILEKISGSLPEMCAVATVLGIQSYPTR